jgi:hypothetical protein
MVRILCLFLVALFITSCDLRSRQEAVDKKETQLAEWEQELNLREKTLNLKENELRQRQHVLDSVQLTGKADSTRPDSAAIYNANIIGLWSVKMVCTETTCSGSAVGDTKSETWDFYYANDHLIARAMAGDNLVRIYTGMLTGTTIALNEVVENTGVTPSTKLLVNLTVKGDKLMEGKREIVRINECKIVYDLQLSKQ